MSRRHWIAAAAVVGLVAAAVVNWSMASERPLVVIVSGIDKQMYLPAMLTERLGYFAEQGLDVRLADAGSGDGGQNELLSGAAQAVVGFYEHAIVLQARGKIIVSLIQFARAPGEVLLVSTKLTPPAQTLADLKGQSLGVPALGSSTDLLTRTLADRQGLHFGDYTPVSFMTTDSFVAAMEQGRIAGGTVSDPTAGRLLKSGLARTMFDLRTPAGTEAALGGCFPGTSLYVEPTWVAKHPDQTQKLVTAFTKTLRYIATHSAAEIADHLPEAYFQGDKPLYVERLSEGKVMFTADGRMPTDCPESALRVMTAADQKLQGKPFDLTQTFTNTFIDKAEAILGR